MSLYGPIVIIDDDEEDCELTRRGLHEVGIKNKVVIFGSGIDALRYLETTEDKPFLILSDIEMPEMTGLELRRKINSSEYLRKKSIPFIFRSSSASREEVEEAFRLNVQGFFTKPEKFAHVVEDLEHITWYWKYCLHPNNEEQF